MRLVVAFTKGRGSFCHTDLVEFKIEKGRGVVEAVRILMMSKSFGCDRKQSHVTFPENPKQICEYVKLFLRHFT